MVQICSTNPRATVTLAALPFVRFALFLAWNTVFYFDFLSDGWFSYSSMVGLWHRSDLLYSGASSHCTWADYWVSQPVFVAWLGHLRRHVGVLSDGLFLHPTRSSNIKARTKKKHHWEGFLTFTIKHCYVFNKCCSWCWDTSGTFTKHMNGWEDAI